MTPESRGIFNLSQIPSRQVAWLWPARIPFGKLTILDGDPGLGKSTPMLDLAARLTAGRALPDEPTPPDEPRRVALLSAEDAAADTIRPRLEAASAAIDRVYVLSHLPDSVGGGLPVLPRLPGTSTRSSSASNPACSSSTRSSPILDPRSTLTATRASAIPSSRRPSSPTAPASLSSSFATSASASRNPLYRGGGSIGLLGAARSGVLVALDPSDPAGARRVLASTKSNLAALPPSLAYRLASAPNGVARVVWEGRAHRRAPRRPPDDRPASVLDDARSVLRTILADGPLPASLVQRQAAEVGLSRSTLNRAREAMAIRPRKVGPTWVWSLPDCPAAQEDTQNS